MRMDDTILPKLHSAQEQVIKESKRFNVVCTGRRWGKLVLGRELLFRLAIRGYQVGWFSFSGRMLDSTWGELAKIPARGVKVRSRLEFPAGGAIEVWNARAKTHLPRFRNYAAVVVDEATLIPDLKEVWADVIFPTLIALRGSAWFLSTPSGASKYFQDLYSQGQDPGFPEWASWKFPSSSNPHLVPETLEDCRHSMCESLFRQEFEAEFLDSAVAT